MVILYLGRRRTAGVEWNRDGDENANARSSGALTGEQEDEAKEGRSESEKERCKDEVE